MVAAVAAPPQAIAGVSAGQEREIETTWPSIAAVGPGRLLGSLMDSIPIPIGKIKLSYLIFGLPMAPLGLIGYLQLKVTGQRYTVTNRSVSVCGALMGGIIKQVQLKDVAEVAIEVLSGQEFYHAGDVVLLNKSGDEILRCAGVDRPDRLRRVILESRDARMQNDDALANINKRK